MTDHQVRIVACVLPAVMWWLGLFVGHYFGRIAECLDRLRGEPGKVARP